MCQNAAKTAGGLLASIEPMIINLLTITGQLNTTAGVALMAAYNAAVTTLESWTQGTAAQNVLEAIGAVQKLLAALPLPPVFSVAVNVILGIVAAVIGILTANSPAPAPPVAVAALLEPHEVQGLHQAAVAADAVTAIHALVPGIKLSRFKPAVDQANEAWNKMVDTNGLPATLKVPA